MVSVLNPNMAHEKSCWVLYVSENIRGACWTATACRCISSWARIRPSMRSPNLPLSDALTASAIWILIVRCCCSVTAAAGTRSAGTAGTGGSTGSASCLSPSSDSGSIIGAPSAGPWGASACSISSSASASASATSMQQAARTAGTAWTARSYKMKWLELMLEEKACQPCLLSHPCQSNPKSSCHASLPQRLASPRSMRKMMRRRQVRAS